MAQQYRLRPGNRTPIQRPSDLDRRSYRRSDLCGLYAPVGNVTSITYYNSAAIPLTFSTVPFGGIIFAGPQAYTGSEAAPQFAPGAFFGLFEGDSAVPSLLIFSIPEPSTWS